jgi:phosphoribosyl 1,2-cyclic phosphate phosphodiesterase
MELIFLGTGGAWGIPELNCDCVICREMRLKGERRSRTAFALSGESNLLVDCGPDIASQLDRQRIRKVDALLITHEHGDHYIGLDELYSFKRTSHSEDFQPIPVYVTSKSWEVIERRFQYLVSSKVIRPVEVEPEKSYAVNEFQFMPFKTDHGAFAAGSVGYIIRWKGEMERDTRLVYTSDFIDVPEPQPELFHPDYLVIQSYWLNEPEVNRPNHMSFQRALGYIEKWKPEMETFLVHMGDGDRVPGDPANDMQKKNIPQAPMKSPGSGEPYPIPLNQAQWQGTVDEIIADRGMDAKITVAYDGLCVDV